MFQVDLDIFNSIVSLCFVLNYHLDNNKGENPPLGICVSTDQTDG